MKGRLEGELNVFCAIKLRFWLKLGLKLGFEPGFKPGFNLDFNLARTGFRLRAQIFTATDNRN